MFRIRSSPNWPYSIQASSSSAPLFVSHGVLNVHVSSIASRSARFSEGLFLYGQQTCYNRDRERQTYFVFYIRNHKIRFIHKIYLHETCCVWDNPKCEMFVLSGQHWRWRMISSQYFHNLSISRLTPLSPRLVLGPCLYSPVGCQYFRTSLLRKQ